MSPKSARSESQAPWAKLKSAIGASALAYWEHQVRDPLTLNERRRVAQQVRVIIRELAKVRPSLPHHHRHQVDGHLIEQAGLGALPRDSARGDAVSPSSFAGLMRRGVVVVDGGGGCLVER